MHEEYKNEEKCECCDESREDCTCEADCEGCDCKRGSVRESRSFTFDKFMDSIVLRESKRHPTGDSPVRERARRHQEKPLNRVIFGVKK